MLDTITGRFKLIEVTEDNYDKFLTFHGLNWEVAEYVIATWDNTENYHKNKSVQQWVEASKYVLKEAGL